MNDNECKDSLSFAPVCYSQTCRRKSQIDIIVSYTTEKYNKTGLSLASSLENVQFTREENPINKMKYMFIYR